MSNDGLGFGCLGVGRVLGCGKLGWRRGGEVGGCGNGAGVRSVRYMAYSIRYGRVAFCIFRRGKTGALRCKGDTPLHEDQSPLSIELFGFQYHCRTKAGLA